VTRVIDHVPIIMAAIRAALVRGVTQATVSAKRVLCVVYLALLTAIVIKLVPAPFALLAIANPMGSATATA